MGRSRQLSIFRTFFGCRKMIDSDEKSRQKESLLSDLGLRILGKLHPCPGCNPGRFQKHGSGALQLPGALGQSKSPGWCGFSEQLEDMRAGSQNAKRSPITNLKVAALPLLSLLQHKRLLLLPRSSSSFFPEDSRRSPPFCIRLTRRIEMLGSGQDRELAVCGRPARSRSCRLEQLGRDLVAATATNSVFPKQPIQSTGRSGSIGASRAPLQLQSFGSARCRPFAWSRITAPLGARSGPTLGPQGAPCRPARLPTR